VIESRAMKWDGSLGTKMHTKFSLSDNWMRPFGNLGVDVMIILKGASFVYVDRTGLEYC
jgi:hypothetical protein